jgi:hypothetical protein
MSMYHLNCQKIIDTLNNKYCIHYMSNYVVRTVIQSQQNEDKQENTKHTKAKK